MEILHLVVCGIRTGVRIGSILAIDPTYTPPIPTQQCWPRVLCAARLLRVEQSAVNSRLAEQLDPVSLYPSGQSHWPRTQRPG